MLRLFVMRHAKSSWAVPGARDFDRLLNKRGKKDLEKLTIALQERNYRPEVVLCSSAERTRRTYHGIAEAIPESSKVSFTEKLYSSGMDDYIALIQGQDTGESIMIIGHNPMCGNLALTMAGFGDQHLLDEISYKYPTGTIAVIDFPCTEWREVEMGSGTLTDCIIPSTL